MAFFLSLTHLNQARQQKNNNNNNNNKKLSNRRATWGCLQVKVIGMYPLAADFFA